MNRKLAIMILLGVVCILSLGYFIYRFPDSNFRDNAMGNLIATIVGVFVGVQVTLWVERELEKQRENKARQEKRLHAQEVLSRVLVQITNVKKRIEFVNENQLDTDLIARQYLPQGDIISSSLYSELTNLDIDWELLLTLDIVIGNIKSLNSIFDIFRNTTLLQKLASNTDLFSNINSDLSAQIILATEAIKDFRNTLNKNFPMIIEEHFGKNE